MTKPHFEQPSLLEAFRGFDEQIKNILADINSPLKLVFATLALASKEAQREFLSIEQMIAALEAAGVSIKPGQVRNALARAGNRVSRRQIEDELHYKLMTRGQREADELLREGNINILYVDGTTPRTSRRSLGEILTQLSGAVCICDPYYGMRTLDTLELIPPACTVRFLTVKTNENPARLSGPLRDFKRERPKIALRIFSGATTVHDRFILSNKNIYIIGHGLKDIGSKESFIIMIERATAPDLMAQVEQNFNNNWANATPL